MVQSVEEFARITEGTNDIRVTLDAKDGFYEALIEGAASPVLTNIIESLQARVRLLRATSMGEPGRSTEVTAELRLVAEAAERRDAAGASLACAQHVRNAAKTALKHLRASESPD